MKKRNKKLQLNKEVIARLNDDSMKNIRGGVAAKDTLSDIMKTILNCYTQYCTKGCTKDCKTKNCPKVTEHTCQCITEITFIDTLYDSPE